jgi:hypothetical protein
MFIGIGYVPTVATYVELIIDTSRSSTQATPDWRTPQAYQTMTSGLSRRDKFLPSSSA